MKSIIILCASITLLSAGSQQAGAGPGELIVNHQPHPFGGLASDTELRDDFGVPFWQRVADDIVLGQSASVGHIKWWGFYGSSFQSPPPAPPATETMRIRLYDARPSDGLPGDVLFQEQFLNPLRTPTGQIVAVGAGPPEYVFQVDLASPLELVPCHATILG
jgi:hypothetical protein